MCQTKVASIVRSTKVSEISETETNGAKKGTETNRAETNGTKANRAETDRAETNKADTNKAVTNRSWTPMELKLIELTP